MPDSQDTLGGDLTDWVDRTDGLTPHPRADSMDSQTRQSLEDAVEARRLLKTLELPVALHTSSGESNSRCVGVVQDATSQPILPLRTLS